jgi:hypothetical protein
MKFVLPQVGTCLELMTRTDFKIEVRPRNKKFLKPHIDAILAQPNIVVEGDKLHIPFSSGTQFMVLQIKAGKLHRRESDAVVLQLVQGGGIISLRTKVFSEIDFRITKPRAKAQGRFYLMNRYQDGGWEELDDEQFDDLPTAAKRAAELCLDGICYGMIRLLHRSNDSPNADYEICTFPAGGFPR